MSLPSPSMPASPPSRISAYRKPTTQPSVSPRSSLTPKARQGSARQRRRNLARTSVRWVSACVERSVALSIELVGGDVVGVPDRSLPHPCYSTSLKWSSPAHSAGLAPSSNDSCSLTWFSHSDISTATQSQKLPTTTLPNPLTTPNSPSGKSLKLWLKVNVRMLRALLVVCANYVLINCNRKRSAGEYL